jgi:hypothetical protein
VTESDSATRLTVSGSAIGSLLSAGTPRTARSMTAPIGMLSSSSGFSV